MAMPHLRLQLPLWGIKVALVGMTAFFQRNWVFLIPSIIFTGLLNTNLKRASGYSRGLNENNPGFD
jgi:hypothetical protein